LFLLKEMEKGGFTVPLFADYMRRLKDRDK